MKTRYIIYILSLMLGIGCSEVELPETSPQLVVEGWIETGRGPVVMVTTTVPVDHKIGSEEDLKKYVVTWGKVTISDGEQEVVLTGMKDDDYFPPYIYTTSSIRGEAGKTYSLKVEYGGHTATAVTTIPDAVPLEDIKVRKSRNNEDGFYMTGVLKDNPDTKDYYKVFIRTNKKDSTYVPSFLGLINDDVLSGGSDEIPINNTFRKLEDGGTSTLFSAEDFVFIRFSTLDKASYDYWNDFDDNTMSRNPLFPVTSVIRTNISGGLGHWSGYGASYYKVSIADSLALDRVW